MTNAEMLFEMIQLQIAYDQAVYEEFETEYDETKTRLALLDEIGETNHELKALWCWWKKTQKPVDWCKVLEELADCWHFALSIYYHSVEDLYGDILNFMAHEYIHKPPKESDNEEFDNINHPEHYTEGKYECIDVMKEVLGFETVEDFCICNAFKYIWRHKKKNELEDLKKANWYLNKIIEWEK